MHPTARRILLYLTLVSLLLFSCQAVSSLPLTGRGQPASSPPPASPGAPSTPARPAATRTARETRASSAAPTPSASPESTPAPSFEVFIHPEGGLFVGDQVSLEVVAPQGETLEDHQVRVEVAEPEQLEIGRAEFKPHGIAGRRQATLLWEWDTSGFDPGEYVLSFSVQPGGPSWTETVSLQPAVAVPPPEPHASWQSEESDCCLIYYISGTAAERDLEDLMEMADRQAEAASESMMVELEEPVEIVLIPRVLGHGGFASDRISVSYLDRNYAGSSFDLVLRHEIIHILDRRLGGELRPSLFVEGLAVYLSGGHFKPEPLSPRAAALLDLGWYIPLDTLVEQFYTSQHEVGYLQGASLIEFMVDEWGWEAFSSFYRDIQPQEGGSQVEAIDAALQEHFQISFSELEARFLQALKAYPVTEEVKEDVRLTVEFYDTVRRYQRMLDPSAYFATAWLLDVDEMRRRGIVADYLRHPSAPTNLALETMLVSAGSHLRAARYDETRQILQAVNAILDEIEKGSEEPFAVEE